MGPRLGRAIHGRTLRLVLLVVAARLLVLGFGWVAAATFRPETLAGGLEGLWNRWDAPHFLEIAANGYGPPADPARIVLLPLYPLTIALGSLVLPPVAAGMLVSLLATIAAAIGLDRLVRLDRPALGRAAVVALLVFPTAHALVAPYSEALFLALSIWAFVAVRRGDPRLAGLLGALAAATRIQGLFLLPALLLEHRDTRGRLGREGAWLGLVGLGVLAYLAINVATFGDPFRFLEVQRTTFHVETAPPWVGFERLAGGIVSGPPGEDWLTLFVAPAASLLLLAWVSGWSVRARGSRRSYALYAGLNLAMFASLSWPISVPRYVLGVFPVFVALAGPIRRAPLLVAACALALGLVTTLFVIGHWAF